MEIFVGNLDEKISEPQLRLFFKGYDKQAKFKLVHLKEELPGGREDTLVYGVVSIPSERLAKKALKKLNFKKLNNKPVIVREFQFRASQNDQRALNWRLKEWLKDERRGKDRRRKLKEVKSLDDLEVTGFEQLSRKL